MSTHRTSNAIQYLGLGAVLIVMALLVGYVATKYFDRQPIITDDDTAVEEQLSETERQLQCIQSLPDILKVSQKIVVAVYRDQMSDTTPIASAANIGGIIVMDEISQKQLASLSKAFAVPPIIAVDQEGGTVQRYKSAGIVPGAGQVAHRLSVDEAYEVYLKDSQYLQQLGITTNFAPVVDVESRAPSPLPGRIYSADAGMVTKYAEVFIAASREAGINPVIKHFPGIGSAMGNTDFGSATTDPLSALQKRDLIPYRQLASKTPDAMVSNAVVPGLTQGQPAVWSTDAVELLRGLGYEDAVVYSDSLTAKAIPGRLDIAALKTWQAGVDIALIVQTREQTTELQSDLRDIIAGGMDALESKKLDRADLNQSVKRIFARKSINACNLDV